ncbi:MAG: hypothetical protein M5R38_04240 [Candidatus Methylomirabilis sp.]|nr:hypothetical protein [Candidatus Methylomirabilis sp.]
MVEGLTTPFPQLPVPPDPRLVGSKAGMGGHALTAIELVSSITASGINRESRFSELRLARERSSAGSSGSTPGILERSRLARSVGRSKLTVTTRDPRFFFSPDQASRPVRASDQEWLVPELEFRNVNTVSCAAARMTLLTSRSMRRGKYRDHVDRERGPTEVGEIDSRTWRSAVRRRRLLHL